MCNFRIFPELLHSGKSREKLVKFSKIQQEFSKFLQSLQHFVKISKKKSAIFNEKIEIRERCKGALGSFFWVLCYGHCTTPEYHEAFFVPTQFHRTSNITETVISTDLRPMETRQIELQSCSADSFFIFARDFSWSPFRWSSKWLVVDRLLASRFLVFSYFRGCFGQVLFSPFFDYGFQNGAKECIV